MVRRPGQRRAERVARIGTLGRQAFGNADEARARLNASHPLLGADRPVDVAATELGARLVERLLQNIEYNLPV